MTKPKLIVFAPIAPREVEFYLKLIPQIRSREPSTQFAFISFVQHCNKSIRRAGFRVYDIYKFTNKKINLNQALEIESKYKIDNLKAFVKHESVTFGTSEETVLQKFLNYIEGFGHILKLLSSDFKNEKPLIVQELGGFVAPLSLYFVSRSKEIPHLFLEPSFFKGRLNFVLNSLNAVSSKLNEEEAPREEVQKYLKLVTENKEIVIPSKDKHHFQDMGIKKILNKRNIFRLREKLTYKYLYRFKQEYEHVGNHTLRALRMWANRKLNEKLYSRLSDVSSKKLIYFPFHVQIDYALTVRSPQYFDQLKLVDEICKIIPRDTLLVAKEHPASIGGFSPEKVSRLIDNNTNFRLLHPSNNTFDVLKYSRLVITINSKSGAEAVMMGKPVIALGDSFYSDSGMVTYIKNRSDLKPTIDKLLVQEEPQIQQKIEKFFTTVWNNSYSGELYNETPENLNKFTDSFMNFMSELRL